MDEKPETHPPAEPPNDADSISETAAAAIPEGDPGPPEEPLTGLHPFPIVAVGASAGGLEAFAEFFNSMPATSGIAFVIVQHLSPPHKSVLTELVQRYTQMEVREVENGMEVRPDTVYIIPPNRYLTIEKDVLYLSPPEGDQGPRNTIDRFFRSLAEDRGQDAIAIILSGTGSDGTLGMRAIKGEAGMVMVQEPDSARYDGMPISAIRTGPVDYILPPAGMPAVLLDYTRAERRGRRRVEPVGVENWLPQILALVLRQTGLDFKQYKQTTVLRRVQRRMALLQLSSLPQYLHHLQEHPSEIRNLFSELLIGVTSFFRDPNAYLVLKERVLPRLLRHKPVGEPLRVWVPACSTGEEAYSIAITIQEYLEQTGQDVPVRIFATDVDTYAIDVARSGLYPQNIAIDVSPDRLDRFFQDENGSYRVKRRLRDSLVFALQNVLGDPPFSAVDLISCRNLLIYLNPDAQSKVLQVFHYSLVIGGVLFLGSSETVGERAGLFSTMDNKWRFFERRGDGVIRQRDWADSGTSMIGGWPAQASLNQGFGVGRESRRDAAEAASERAQRALVDIYAPAAAVIVDEHGDIVYFHGHSGRYLEPAPGQASLNILYMAREGLAGKLAGGVRDTLRRNETIVFDDLAFRGEEGVGRAKVTIRPVLGSGSSTDLAVITFEGAASDFTTDADAESLPSGPDSRVRQLQQELLSTKAYLQATLQELEAANEDLQATNEEFQSTVEELQSSNEELETSKEELQSLNEELTTVNAELRAKIDDLSDANDDLSNLLQSTELGTIFLDGKLRVKRFTSAVTEIMNLIPADIGRPLTDIASNLHYDNLREDVLQVMQTHSPRTSEVQGRNGRWYEMRIIPYRTLEDRIDGVVINFINLTDYVRLRERLHILTSAIEHDTSMVTMTDAEGRIEYVNPRFTTVTGYRLDEAVGRKASFMAAGGDEAADYREMWRAAESDTVWQGTLHSRRRDDEDYTETVRLVPVAGAKGVVTHYVKIAEDTTPGESARQNLERTQAVVGRMVEGRRSGLVVVSREGKITFANPEVSELLALPYADIIGRPESVLFGEARRDGRPLADSDLPSRRVLADGRAIDGDKYTVRKGTHGMVFTLQVSAVPLSDREGEVDRVAVVLDLVDPD